MSLSRTEMALSRKEMAKKLQPACSWLASSMFLVVRMRVSHPSHTL